MKTTNKNVPIYDLKRDVEEHWDEVLHAIEGVLRSGKFILSENVLALESELAGYLGIKHAITLNSGTDALVLALDACGICPGDEVITTPFTFFATAESISRVGATPIFVDIDADTLNMDVRQVEQMITKRTKAIIPVHLFGLPAEMEPLLSIAARYNLKVIEDCAQSFGATYCGKLTGTMGDVGCYSFFPSKNLGAYGDGGLVVTDDDETAERLRMLRTHGSKKQYQNEILGYNSRLDELQAAILRVKLPRVNQSNALRKEIANRYNALLAGLIDVKLPVAKPPTSHVYHQYTIQVPAKVRPLIQESLRELGYDTRVYYPVPLHRLPVYEHMNINLPVSERAAEQVLSLPMGMHVTPRMQEEMCACVRRAFE